MRSRMLAPKLLDASLVWLVLAISGSALLSAQSTAGYAGVWKLNNDLSEPKRNGDVTLQISFEAPELIMEVTSTRSSSPPRHSTQTLLLDGKQTTWIGADGDRFDATVERKNDSLLVSIVEHEDGRTLRSKETWTLTENGQRIARVRDREGKTPETFIYDKQPRQ